MSNPLSDVTQPPEWTAIAQSFLETMMLPAGVFDTNGRIHLRNDRLVRLLSKPRVTLTKPESGADTSGHLADPRLTAGLRAPELADIGFHCFETGRAPPPAPPCWFVRARLLARPAGLPPLIVASFDELPDADPTTTHREREGWKHRVQSLAVELTLAGELERRRLAVALHDGPVQEMVVLLRMLRRLRPPPGEAKRDQHDDCIEQIMETLRATRNLTGALSPPALYELGLVPALVSLVTDFRTEHTLDAVLIAGSAPLDVSRPAAIICFRSVRELLMNCVKHAPDSEVVVTVGSVAAAVRIVVQDAGPGFDPRQRPVHDDGTSAFGLSSIRAQAVGVGGTFDLRSEPGKGCRAELSIPANALAQEARAEP